MFTKMRAILAAERRRADEAEKQLAEYRLAAESQRRAEEHHARMCQNAEIHRVRMQQGAEMHRVMLATLAELTSAISQLRQERNGNRR